MHDQPCWRCTEFGPTQPLHMPLPPDIPALRRNLKVVKIQRGQVAEAQATEGEEEMTDETTTDPYAALMAAVDMAVDEYAVAAPSAHGYAAVRREAERLVLGQQIALLEELPCEGEWQRNDEHDCIDAQRRYQRDPDATFPMCDRCRKLAELRAALAALDDEVVR